MRRRRWSVQEAGLIGKIEKMKIGSFHYHKRLKNGAAILCRVDVFPLHVRAAQALRRKASA